MSRLNAPKSFASKGMFDALAADGEEDELEVEEQEDPVDVVTDMQLSPAPLSKSARKRLAKQASRALHSSTLNGDSLSQSLPTISNNLPAKEDIYDSADKTITQAAGLIDSAKTATSDAVSAFVNGDRKTAISNGHGDSQSKPPPQTEPSENVSASKDSANGITLPEIANGTLEALPSVLPAEPAPLPPTAETPVSPSTVPTSVKFEPDLPDSLPQPTGNALPANRKRKQPQDFTPHGPSEPEAPSSPSKTGVKFEDGVAPGEGREGEKTIPKEKKNQNVVERTVWTFIMIGVFILLLCLGHPYMILLVMLCQTLVYKEVTALFELRDQGSKKINDGGDKWSKTLNWYFFVVTNYFLYGESIIYYFKHIVFVDAYFIPFARNHRFISFMLYVVGFVGFVANLERQYLRQQFALFCWVHISLFLIVVSSHFIVNNILEGHVWFFIPASLVICNDVMAYVCGKLFGRTPLIKLSPKKTVEGFVGAFICTLIFGLAWGTFFMRFPYMICPARDLGTNAFSQVSCRPNPVFIWRDFEFTGPARQILQSILGHAPPAIPYAPFQLHVLVMATFASLFAPFGGFFASGFKRAFNIKDFGHSIPGHGGMTDRMDCQFMMGMFAYVYYSSLIRVQNVTVGSIMQTVVTSLSGPEQLELFADLKRYLDGQGMRFK
ncbi:cytidylyltransferase family-domain-containing protein [Naematelia encephala]|uniref:Phosphatidate cytidylyltransferase n=1 Tax=Naematelia encephala TaxID=71784 RepID=A0A1Y2AZ88_9TREE|nr:cytidylyltransferase family-domain-containing protein [Naematelia encephala]